MPRIIGISQFGLFTGGTLPATRLTALPDGLCTAAYPAMVKACANDPRRGAALVLRYLLIGAAVGAALAGVGTLLAAPIGNILFPGRAGPFAQIACVTLWSLPLLAIESVMGNALNAAGRDAAQARASIPAAALSLLLAIVLVCTDGLTGACWSMVLRPAVRAAFLSPLMFRTFRAPAARPIKLSVPTPLLRKAG